MGEIARAAVFDLDGVIVDTARFHFAAWRRLAREFGFELSDDLGESLKGVGREAALRIVLASGGVVLGPEESSAAASRKNRYYNEHLESLDADALLPGALEGLAWLRERGIPVALASASRNARTILATTGIESSFDEIVDGTVVTAAKPDPAVFRVAAERLGIPPAHCVVFEDAVAGVRGALRAGCRVVGIGDPAVLVEAELVVPTLADVPWATVFAVAD